MPDPLHPIPPQISEENAQQRSARGLAMAELLTQFWLENPALLKQAGRRAQEFMMPIEQARLLHLDDLR